MKKASSIIIEKYLKWNTTSFPTNAFSKAIYVAFSDVKRLEIHFSPKTFIGKHQVLN